MIPSELNNTNNTTDNTTDNTTVGKKAAPDAGLKLRVSVRLFGSIRAAAGKDREEIEIPSDCVAYELLQLLSALYGNKFRDEVFLQNDGELRDDLTVSVGGVIMEHTKLKSLKLPDGAVIALLPTFPGGG